MTTERGKARQSKTTNSSICGLKKLSSILDGGGFNIHVNTDISMTNNFFSLIERSLTYSCAYISLQCVTFLPAITCFLRCRYFSPKALKKSNRTGDTVDAILCLIIYACLLSLFSSLPSTKLVSIKSYVCKLFLPLQNVKLRLPIFIFA